MQPGLTVTEVRTHLVPEKLTIKSQAQESATTDSAPSLAEAVSAAETALPAGQQVSQPAGAGNNSAHRDRSGAEASAPDAAAAQPAQSAETNAASAVFTPGQGTPPATQQVFDAIKSAMPATAEGMQAAQASDAAAAAYEPMKTITIALQPDGLGAVSIQLSLKSNQLGLRLEASETSTAQLLRQGSADLSGLLQSAGYAVGSIAVHSAPQTAQGDAQAQGGQGGQNNAFNPSGSGGSGTGGGSAGTGGQPQPQRQPGSRDVQQEGGYGRTETANSDGSYYV